jgi:hypothetical protein
MFLLYAVRIVAPTIHNCLAHDCVTRLQYEAFIKEGIEPRVTELTKDQARILRVASKKSEADQLAAVAQVIDDLRNWHNR